MILWYTWTNSPCSRLHETANFNTWEQATKVHVPSWGVNCSCFPMCKVLGGTCEAEKHWAVPPFFIIMMKSLSYCKEISSQVPLYLCLGKMGEIQSVPELRSTLIPQCFFLWDNLLCEDGYFCLICSLRCDFCMYVWCMYTKSPTQTNGET